MKGFILGCHRLTLCPKWTPASISSLRSAIAKVTPFVRRSLSPDCVVADGAPPAFREWGRTPALAGKTPSGGPEGGIPRGGKTPSQNQKDHRKSPRSTPGGNGVSPSSLEARGLAGTAPVHPGGRHER